MQSTSYIEYAYYTTVFILSWMKSCCASCWSQMSVLIPKLHGKDLLSLRILHYLRQCLTKHICKRPVRNWIHIITHSKNLGITNLNVSWQTPTEQLHEPPQKSPSAFHQWPSSSLSHLLLAIKEFSNETHLAIVAMILSHCNTAWHRGQWDQVEFGILTISSLPGLHYKIIE